MKKNLYTGFLILLTFQICAQTDCDHNVSTKFENPTNNSLPSGNTPAPLDL